MKVLGQSETAQVEMRPFESPPFETIDEEAIAALVDRFYARVRQDPTLAPLFAQAIDDWDPHLATMRRFWASVLLRAGTYRGNPVQAHERLEGLVPAHFSRWLELFSETATELFSSPERERICHKASLIGATLQSRVCRGDAVTGS